MSPGLAALARNSFIHVAVAFLAMGGWAAFANRSHPMPAPLAAALIQGTISAGITFVLKRTVEALARRFTGWAALVAPPAIACAISAATLVVVHTLGGTPEIGRTIALPLTISTGYAALYSLALWRARRGGR